MKFQLSPERIYQFLADSKLHATLTGQKAEISSKVGGSFKTRGGNVTGVNVDLVPGKRLVQAWRTKKFPEGIFSMVTLQFTRSKNGTELVLTHRGVPKELIPAIEKDWRVSYWEKLRVIKE